MANVALGVLALCAVVLTASNVRARFFPPPPSAERIVPQWETYAVGGHHVVSERAPVTLVAFVDYQCPYCRKLHTLVEDIQRQHPGRLLVVWRHFPLLGHPEARPAAIAAECAAAQGRFHEMHDALFGDQVAVMRGQWKTLAARAGVPDSAAFSRCIASTAPDSLVDIDVAAAQRLEADGTPTVLVDSAEFDGVPTGFSKVVTKLLAAN